MIKWLDNLWNGHTPTEQEQQFIEIVQDLLKHPKTTVKMTPQTHKYYLSNAPKHYFVMIKNSGIQITNSKFSFAKNLHPKTYTMILNLVDEVMEVDRQKFEDKIFQNESLMLEKVLLNLR
tara:strand:- start:2169 stop:2528 length:360 start_codon:yes stop_codon:yes gene_type:complete